MRSTIIKLAIGLAGSAIAGLAFPIMAQAQGHFVFAQQGVIVNTIATTTTFVTAVAIGNGYVGTTTGATMLFAANYNSPVEQPVLLNFRAFDDANYTTASGGACNFAAAPASSISTSSATQLVPTSCNAGGSYVLDPTKYYVVTITSAASADELQSGYTSFGIIPPAHTILTGAFGSTFVGYEPQWALVGNGFTITPTASSTGLYLSGAQMFCNQQFGTSINGILGIGTDIANGLCQVFGYMFVPTPNSVQAFADLEPTLGTKLPFSYVFGVVSTWQSLSASSTANFPKYTINLKSLGIGSTSAMGNILPDQMDLLSTTTVNKYLPSGVHDTLFGLAEVAIALLAMFGMYEEAKHLLKT